jgi:hypothetical protein
LKQAVGEAIVAAGHQVDVLHVNHHGANNTSATRFLELINPNIAIISAGNGNQHRHPTNAALQRLYDANVYRTILTSFGTSQKRRHKTVRTRVAVYQNDIIIESDGQDYEVSTKRTYKTNKNCVTDSSC